MHVHHHHAGHDHAAHEHDAAHPEVATRGGHDRASEQARRLRWALGITLAVLVAEVVGGLLANSLALLADAGHVLTDAAALALSLFVTWFSRRPVTPRRTYGYLRWEILAAFLNGTTLIFLSAWILWEAVARLREPQPVAGGLMLVVAVAGLIANLVSARLLHPVTGTSLNVRGAYLHVLGDLLGSVGAVFAALVIELTGWLRIDPIASLFVTLLVVHGAWRLVRESVDVLLESTPSHISAGAVRAQLEAIPGVESVHDLHIWTVTSGVYAMSAHAVVREPERQQHVLEHAIDAMRLFGIGHVTVQIEQREMYDREIHLHE
ncbi:MAG TPA: cation diffusion facilitator family transporter [Gemmatimonadaceae bacterium]|nr:cation diffusion facilitator family transporter [Gemmatimonadaceae bacterium]